LYETIVIGAGQAGLAMGYYLKQHDHSFLILEKNSEVGEMWGNRYDSLVLFTPRLYSSLPGLELKGNAHEYPTKNEIENYLKAYVETFNLPIQYDTEVTMVKKKGNLFHITSDRTEYQAKNVLIATGPFQKPRIPAFANDLSKDVLQLHSSDYRNPSQLIEGKVLVVGGGNSGAQITEEIAREREVYLSTSCRFSFMPLSMGNRIIFWCFDKLGILKASSTSYIGRKIQKRGDPIFGFELKKAIQEGKVIIKGRTLNCNGNIVTFNDDSLHNVHNVIWATGFTSDYSWLDVTGILGENGKPIHNRGVTNVPGLYFLGLPWQYRRGSALLQGVGNDANYLMEQLKK
jgi:putative flavoprotein involved in K+ transport